MIQSTDFVNQAKRLIDPTHSPTEVDCRTAVSRAYYFLFHKSFEHLKIKYGHVMVKSIEEYLTKKNNTIRIDHAKLKKLERQYLKQLGVNLHGTIPDVLWRLNQRKYGRDFIDFRDDRNDADYELAKTFPLPDTTTKVSKIENLANSITIL